MRIKETFRKKFNYKSTEASSSVLLATLILSGWLVSLAVYLVVNN